MVLFHTLSTWHPICCVVLLACITGISHACILQKTPASCKRQHDTDCMHVVVRHICLLHELSRQHTLQELVAHCTYRCQSGLLDLVNQTNTYVHVPVVLTAQYQVCMHASVFATGLYDSPVPLQVSGLRKLRASTYLLQPWGCASTLGLTPTLPMSPSGTPSSPGCCRLVLYIFCHVIKLS